MRIKSRHDMMIFLKTRNHFKVQLNNQFKKMTMLFWTTTNYKIFKRFHYDLIGCYLKILQVIKINTVRMYVHVNFNYNLCFLVRTMIGMIIYLKVVIRTFLILKHWQTCILFKLHSVTYCNHFLSIVVRRPFSITHFQLLLWNYYRFICIFA